MPVIKDPTSPLSSSGGMTPKTPLSKMAVAFKRGATKANESFDEDKHNEESETLQKNEKWLLWIVWFNLLATGVLSSTLSFVIDEFTFYAGLLRSKLTMVSAEGTMLALIMNLIVALIARIICRTTVEAEGGGFPEMKAMLFGKVLYNFMSLRVLFVKATTLAMLVAAGLPMGKEGPNVHMAGCIAFNLTPSLFKRRTDRGHSASTGGAAGGGADAAGARALLAACAVGVGASFSAPIGGVIFALELMLPQTYDSWAYWGCFAASISGAITYAVWRTETTAGSTVLLPLISTNVLPNEGANSDYPMLRLGLDIGIGAICGIAGALFVRTHAFCGGTLKRWRLREPDHFAEPSAAPSDWKQRGSMTMMFDKGNLEAPLIQNESEQKPRRGCFQIVKRTWLRCLGGKWRDLLQVALTVIANTLLASQLPLLGSKPQPLLMNNILDKNLYDSSDEWVLPWAGTGGTLALCFLMKFFITMFSLILPTPGGMVLPTMIIGGLLARSIVHNLVPIWFINLVTTANGVPMSPEEHGAFLARCAIVGSCCFCAGVSRAFAMAITVFEVLALPNSVLPLCSSTLVAIFLANKISLPFFDQNLAGRNLGGIPGITISEKAMEPAMQFMERVNLEECIPQKSTCRELMTHLMENKRDNYAIIRPINEDHEHWDQAILEGNITRKHLERLLKRIDPQGDFPDKEVDLCDTQFQIPPDGSEQLVDANPPHVLPNTTVKDVYLLMKHSVNEGVIYVTDKGVLKGSVSFTHLMSRSIL